MTDIEEKALALVNEMRAERGGVLYYELEYVSASHTHEALCRAIEQHEAFKQKVSDIVDAYIRTNSADDWEKLTTLVIPKPKPDPLEEVLMEIDHAAMWVDKCAEEIRAALGERGWEIREKGQ